MCSSGVGAEAPPKVLGCDPREANIRIPRLQGISGEGSYVRRGKWLASLLKSWLDNRSAKVFTGVGIYCEWISISCSTAKRVILQRGSMVGPCTEWWRRSCKTVVLSVKMTSL